MLESQDGHSSSYEKYIKHSQDSKDQESENKSILNQRDDKNSSLEVGAEILQEDANPEESSLI